MNLRVGQFILSSYDGVKKVYVQPSWLGDEEAIAVAKGMKKIESIEDPRPNKIVQEDEDMYDDTEIRGEMRAIKKQLSDLFNRVENLSLSGGGQTFVVAPLEKIRKDFLEEAKQYVLGEVGKLDSDQKKILKFIETQGRGCKIPDILDHCLHRSSTSGGNRQAVSTKIAEMNNLMRKDKNSIVYPHLKEHIKTYLSPHGATGADIQQIYDHILAGLLEGK